MYGPPLTTSKFESGWMLVQMTKEARRTFTPSVRARACSEPSVRIQFVFRVTFVRQPFPTSIPAHGDV